MRRFDPEYLRRTREGMWEDRSALADLDLDARERILDVGCGTGELTRVLAAESEATVVGLDADLDLLEIAARGGPDAGRDEADPRGDGPSEDGAADPTESEGVPVVAGDALRLPFRENAFDLVVCQALLINLPDPQAAVAEFARVSSDIVAAVEPDNAAVTVESTVEAEVALERRAREAYLDGVDTDVTLGAAGELFREAGLSDVRTTRHDHVRTVAPPYSERALRAARRKATGAGISDDRATMLSGGLSVEEFARLRSDWRSMGREVVAAMQERDYRREETVPFFVTVGRV